jgi:hypothetical protein
LRGDASRGGGGVPVLISFAIDLPKINEERCPV